MAKIQALLKRRNISENRKSELNSAGNTLREKTNIEYGFFAMFFQVLAIVAEEVHQRCMGLCVCAVR